MTSCIRGRRGKVDFGSRDFRRSAVREHVGKFDCLEYTRLNSDCDNLLIMALSNDKNYFFKNKVNRKKKSK